jgi:hypothetical protein
MLATRLTPRGHALQGPRNAIYGAFIKSSAGNLGAHGPGADGLLDQVGFASHSPPPPGFDTL